MKRGRIRLRFTGLWFLFGPVLGCMWIAAVNYANNLVYGVLYLVAALSFISIFHTWRNLASVGVEHVRVRPSFAGEEIEVEIHLRNGAAHPCYNLAFDRLDRTARPGRRRLGLRPRGGGTIHLDAKDARAVPVVLAPLTRGRYRFDALVVRSAYPFGLFGASFQIAAEVAHYVYPAAQGKPELPELRSSGQEGTPPTGRSGDDFSGVRAYSPGESLRHVDWKAFARGRPLVVKQFTGGQDRELWLDARLLSDLPHEEKLSQLALWAVEAEESEIPYGLSLGVIDLLPDLGAQHQRRVLEMLAVAART
jgi:uncharacterized protein (DUF58 family)